MSTTLQKIKDSISDSGFDGSSKQTTIDFVVERSQHYADILKVPVEDVLSAWEAARNYATVNYYQNANFPKITGDVLLMDSEKQFKDFCAGKGFMCGNCRKNIYSPYECALCGWKTWGLFGPGKGATFVVLKPAMRGQWIFRPYVMEHQSEAKTN